MFEGADDDGLLVLAAVEFPDVLPIAPDGFADAPLEVQ
jgi:hypothetical protein